MSDFNKDYKEGRISPLEYIEKLTEQLRVATELIEEAYPEMMLLKYKAVMEKMEPYKYINWQSRADMAMEEVVKMQGYQFKSDGKTLDK